MARISDLIYFAVTLFILGGAVAGIVFVVNKVSEITTTTKMKLKEKGYDVSHHGVSVQTQKRFNREDYVDATQRGLVKAFNASSISTTKDDGAGTASHRLHMLEPTIKATRSALLRRKSDNK